MSTSMALFVVTRSVDFQFVSRAIRVTKFLFLFSKEIKILIFVCDLIFGLWDCDLMIPIVTSLKFFNLSNLYLSTFFHMKMIRFSNSKLNRPTNISLPCFASFHHNFLDLYSIHSRFTTPSWIFIWNKKSLSFLLL